MLRSSSRARTAELQSLKESSILTLERLQEDIELPGLDLTALRAQVESAESAALKRRGILDLRGKHDDEATPKVLMYHVGDPLEYIGLFAGSLKAYNGANISIKSTVENRNVRAETQSFADSSGSPKANALITVKPADSMLQAISLTHEITHWVDIANGITDTDLLEKRAHHITYHMKRITGSSEFTSADAIIRGQRALNSTVSHDSLYVASALVTQGNHDFATISPQERDMLAKTVGPES